MTSIIIFNDSHQSDGFERTVKLMDQLLEKHELRTKAQFIEDYMDDDGEYAWHLSIVPDDLPYSDKELSNDR